MSTAEPRKGNMKLSLVVPCYNEAENIDAFFRLACQRFQEANLGSFELIFVDDGSTDNTFAKLSALQLPAGNPGRIVVIELSRNFGKEAAMLAGLNNASGEFVGIIDADLQQDPATSIEMLSFLEANPEYDSVVAVQKERHEGALLKWCKRRFYRAFNAVGDVEIPPNASDFRVMRRYVADALTAMPEYYRFSKGLFAWVGFNTYCMEYQPDKRSAGKSTWSFGKLMSYALGGIVSFSTWPLRMVLYLGLLTSLAAIIYLIIIVFEYLFVGIQVPGYPTLACLILLFCGIVMLALGIFGEYIGRIYIEGKHRPAYITRRIVSSDGAEPGASRTHAHTDDGRKI